MVTMAFNTNPIDIFRNNLYLVNNEVWMLYQAVKIAPRQLKNTIQSEVPSGIICSTTKYPKKNKVMAIVLTTIRTEKRFRISRGELEMTKIFSRRKEHKIDKIATKLRKTLYVPENSGPYQRPKTKPPKTRMIWATVFPAKSDKTPLAFLVWNFWSFDFKCSIS